MTYLIKFSACLLVVALVANATELFRNDVQRAVLPVNVPNYMPVTHVEPAVLPTALPTPVPTVVPTMVPTIEKPPVNVPVPRVIGHTYHIFRTVMKPQWFRQMITVPYLQRFVRTFQVPILETIHIQKEIPF